MTTLKLKDAEINFEVHSGLVPEDTIFFHGNLASNRWWQPALQVWKNKAKPGQKGSLIFAEWRGCGKSTGLKSEKDLNLSLLASDYLALADHLKIKRANIVAHSTGGLIALQAMLDRPAIFHRAVLLDSVAATGVQFGPEMYAAFTQMSQDRNFCHAVMSGTVYGSLDDAQMNALVDEAFSVDPAIWHGVPQMLQNIDLRDSLKKISPPILVLHGEHDAILPMDGSKELARLLPQARFQELKGRGHSTNVEAPELFVDIVDQFLFG